jgi:hypothetical protein
MEIAIHKTMPAEWKNKNGVSYDTRFLYTGFRRYDVEKKKLSQMILQGNTVLYSESICDASVFSRNYNTEYVKVTNYSESPRVWSEELSPYEIYFFVQQPTHVA